MNEIAPGFLIAMPQLTDPRFRRAVVLMLEHGSEGAMGLVINRPSNMKLGEVARSHGVDPGPGVEEAFAFIGGPVQPERGFVLHRRPELPEVLPVCEGLYLSASVESLRALMACSADQFRLVLGYSGWGPGQLEREIQEGSWLTAPCSAPAIFKVTPGAAWGEILHGMGIEPALLQHTEGIH